MNEWEWNLLEDQQPLDYVEVGGVHLTAGDRVRLRPRAGGDIFDLALAGKTATIEALEHDYEGVCHVAVVLDDDPGRDLGLQRQPGHRFFFTPAEIEPVPAVEEPAAPVPTILVAGIGNVFFGDDGFGVEVAQRLSQLTLPPGVRVIDFGIRGFDLACALDGPDVCLFVDACSRGAAPGTLHVIEPDLSDLVTGSEDAESPVIEPHGLDPVSVIRLARNLGCAVNRILVVGCEPESLGGEDGRMGLSAPVSAAVDRAVPFIESLVDKLLRNEPLDS